MKKLNLLFVLLLVFVVLSCSSDPIAEGDKLYQQGEYTQALKMYGEALKAQPQNMVLREKAALATVKVGQQLYQRRKVISPFAKRYEDCLALIPENPSPEFSKEFSMVLYELAMAYMAKKPQNNIEKRENFDKVLTYFDEALFYDPDNATADEALRKFQEEHFAEMLEKGNNYYAKARKEKNDLYYLNAEYYFKKANEFKPDDDESMKMLTKVRKINLDKINPDIDFPLAVSGSVVKDDYTGILVYLENRSSASINLLAVMFTLIDKESNEYNGEATDVFNVTFKEGPLASAKSFEGAVSFKTGGKKIKSFEKLIFESPDGMQTIKYFP